MTTAYPLAWPTSWPRSRSRSPAKFGIGASGGDRKPMTLTAALERLDRELTLLGATGPILSTNVERHLDGRVRLDRAAPADPGAAAYFTLAGKPTVLACDRWNRVADNIAALAKHVEALRGMDRWGVGTAAQAFAGYTALPAPEQWWQVLGLPSTATVAEAEAAHRRLIQTAEIRGSDTAMARLNTARDAARKAAAA